MERRTLLVAGSAVAGSAIVLGVGVPMVLRPTQEPPPAPTPAVAPAPTGGPAPGIERIMTITEFDRALGSADAQVVMVEYGSFTCPHCRDFNNNTLPELKTRYIDSSKVQYVHRPFVLNGPDLVAALAARCVPADQYFAFKNILYKDQRTWIGDGDPASVRETLATWVGLVGVARDRYDACQADEALTDQIIQLREFAGVNGGVDSTPTFFVNGQKIEGALALDVYVEAIEAKLAEAAAG